MDVCQCDSRFFAAECIFWFLYCYFHMGIGAGTWRRKGRSVVESVNPVQLALSFGEKVKVLVVEDYPDTREMLALFLAGHGYTVVTARDGREALDALEQDPTFDVVLLDVFIPKVGGLEVLKEIHDRMPQLGVILLTALADKEIAQDALRLGAFDYILKPFDLGQVESSVVACLGHRDYQQQSWWRRLVSRPAA